MPQAPFKSESQRLATLPFAVVQALSALIDFLELPSSTRVELRTMRSQICRIYKVPDPQHAAAPQDVAQLMAEEDGEDLQDAP